MCAKTLGRWYVDINWCICPHSEYILFAIGSQYCSTTKTWKYLFKVRSARSPTLGKIKFNFQKYFNIHFVSNWVHCRFVYNSFIKLFSMLKWWHDMHSTHLLSKTMEIAWRILCRAKNRNNKNWVGKKTQIIPNREQSNSVKMN